MPKIYNLLKKITPCYIMLLNDDLDIPTGIEQLHPATGPLLLDETFAMIPGEWYEFTRDGWPNAFPQ